VQLSTIPKSFQLVVAGHLHAHQQLESRGTTLIYPGSTERTAFSEETEKKGFVWLELTKDGLASKPEFIPTPARRLQTIDFPIPETGDLTSLLKSEMETKTDRELVLRLRLKGKVTPELLATYRRPVLQTFGAANFFHVLLDEAWELQHEKPLDALPRTTPLQELERYFEGQIAEATSERKKELREALETAKDILKEFGAW
jgi:DNA repair exonuclease SbcCD nuclease subunit